MSDTERRLAAVLAEHAMVSGFDEIGVWFKYACGCAATGDSDEWHRAHLAAALLPVVAEIEAEARVGALREAADEMDEFAAETYPEDIFRRPTSEQYAEISALLKRERGHQLDGIAADAMSRAIRVQANRLRHRATEVTDA